jgi:hypothetical protein
MMLTCRKEARVNPDCVDDDGEGPLMKKGMVT